MKQQKSPKHYVRWAIYAALAVLLAAALVHLKGDLLDALRVSKSVSPGWIALGVGLILGSVACTSLIYMLLSPKPLRFGRTMTVQTASLFVNKVLPSGSGALGLSYLYLRSNKVGKLAALSLVALNNTIGFVGHLTLLALVLLGDHADIQLPEMHLPRYAAQYALLGLAVLAVFGCMVYIIARRNGKRFIDLKQLKALGAVLKNPRRSFGALLVSMALTLCYVGCLAIAVSSLGLDLALPVLLIVLSVSVFATAVIPSPGGIGASEAGMFVALRAYDVAAPEALAVAILYRVMTFWLPLVVGAVAFVVVERKKLITYNL